MEEIEMVDVDRLMKYTSYFYVAVKSKGIPDEQIKEVMELAQGLAQYITIDEILNEVLKLDNQEKQKMIINL